MDRIFFALGSFSAALGVIAGAFGAHGLRSKLTPELMEVFQTGVKYHLIHALGLIAVAWAVQRWGGGLPVAAGWLFVAGTVIFSGSLYTLSLTGVRALGAVTPVGGLAFIVGWVLLGLAAVSGR
jgi:uncharacterized membrane protein YgdD (TMEM256/DUF423 family)